MLRQVHPEPCPEPVEGEVEGLVKGISSGPLRRSLSRALSGAWRRISRGAQDGAGMRRDLHSMEQGRVERGGCPSGCSVRLLDPLHFVRGQELKTIDRQKGRYQTRETAPPQRAGGWVLQRTWDLRPPKERGAGSPKERGIFASSRPLVVPRDCVTQRVRCNHIE